MGATRSAGWLVKFKIDRDEVSFDFPTFVTTDVKEEHVVTVARHHLAMVFQAIAEEKSGWLIPEADREKYLAKKGG